MEAKTGHMKSTGSAPIPSKIQKAAYASDKKNKTPSKIIVTKDGNLGGNSIRAVWGLIDQPEIWKRLTWTTKILQSKRLMSLMKKPKNEIVKLPVLKTIVRQFYCVVCADIPFPWITDANYGLPLDNESPYPEGAFLCKKGHVVCRACYQSCFKCTATKLDLCNNSHGGQKPTNKRTRKKVRHGASGSMGKWGQTQLCFSLITLRSCFFLRDMIMEAEFACQYYYCWCPFRGRGKELQKHEQKCPLGPSSTSHRPDQAVAGTSTYIQTVKGLDDGYETAILSFSLSTAMSQTNDQIRKVVPDWDLLNPRFIAERKAMRKGKANYK